MNKTTVSQQAKTASLLPPVHGILQRKCSCGNQAVASRECGECKKKKNSLQRKLLIGASNDPLEREADQVAGRVMAMPSHSAVSGIPLHIQRYAGQVTEGSIMDTAPASVDRVLVDSGRPLESMLRQDMEQRFGHDFSQVRVHTGEAAEQSAREMEAQAYTVGHNVVFGAGHFSPEAHEGRRLIAHELTHVVRQLGSDGIRIDPSDKKRGLSHIGLQEKPNLIPMALHAGGDDQRSSCTKYKDEESLKTSPLPDGGIVDPLEEEEKQALESWIVGGKETSMTNNKARSDDDLLGSWVVGGAATPGTNTIKCDGSGGIVVQAEGTGNAAQTACLGDCIIQHEESHRTDALAANANICNGATSGNIVTVNTAAERKATEVRASNVEINCLRAKPETDACRATIADRIRQMIAYRDSF